MATSTKRKAAPRKAAVKVPSDGLTNGHPTDTVNPPELFVEREQPEGDDPQAAAEPVSKSTGLSHPYGDKKLYVYTPDNDAYPIVFPHISEVPADAFFFWKIYEMNEMFQAFEWMKLAEIPRAVQQRVMLLPDGEKQRFFTGWFNAVVSPQGVAPPGES